VRDDAPTAFVVLVDEDFDHPHHTKIGLNRIAWLCQVDVIRTDARRDVFALLERFPLLWQGIGQPG
jgi:hypothetical protein